MEEPSEAASEIFFSPLSFMTEGGIKALSIKIEISYSSLESNKMYEDLFLVI